MAENSKIEWTNHTANLWWGCTKVHAGCDNCYAEYLSETRKGKGVWGNDKPRAAVKGVWKDLERYQRLASETGEIHRVFVGSMMDIFEKPMPMVDWKGNPLDCTTDTARQHFFSKIPTSPNLLFLLLTKRPSNIIKYAPKEWLYNRPKNVMFGSSVSDQATADTLIPQLIGAGIRFSIPVFLSVEPMLDRVNLRRSLMKYLYDRGKDVLWADKKVGDFIDWVIVGGESGHNKRPFNCDWARELRTECETERIAFFFKQVDKVQPIPDDLLIRQFPQL